MKETPYFVDGEFRGVTNGDAERIAILTDKGTVICNKETVLINGTMIDLLSGNSKDATKPEKPMPAAWICEAYEVVEIETINEGNLAFTKYECKYFIDEAGRFNPVGFVFAENPDEIHDAAHKFLTADGICVFALDGGETPITAKWIIFRKAEK